MNLNSLLKLSTVKRYNKDVPILEQGLLAPEEMLVLLQGQVGVFKEYGTPGQQQLETLGPGDFVGEHCLFLGHEPLQTVVALGPVIAVAITLENVSEVFATQPELSINIVRRTLQSLENLRQEHEALIADVRAGVATKKLQEAESKASRSSQLFPDGHGSYQLPIDNALEQYLYEDTVTCPLCGHAFKNLLVIFSRLRRDGNADPDLRVRYKDFEPMYYDVIACPSCLFAAQTEAFKSATKRLAASINEEVGRFRPEVALKTGYERDTFTVFAGYYLALLCAPVLYDQYQLEQAKLWQKIGWMYNDLGDQKMNQFAVQNSLTEYLYAYEHFRLPPKQEQQVCYLVGDLFQRMGDLVKARKFFFDVKANKTGTPVLNRQADIRLEELRSLLNPA